MGVCILLPTYLTYLPDLNTLVGKYVGTYFFSFRFLSWRVSYILGWRLPNLLIARSGIQVCQLDCCKIRILPSRGK